MALSIPGMPPRWWLTFGGVLCATSLVGAGGYLIGYTQGIDGSQATRVGVKKRNYGSEKDLEAALSHISKAIGASKLTTSHTELHKHGYSTWSSLNAPRLPHAVTFPSTPADVVEIAQICHRHHIPMIPYGGGSSVEANFAAPYGGLSVDLSNMNRILSLHEDDMDVVVQPGVNWMTLNESLKAKGLFFPVDPGPTATIGGMVATSCSGTNAVRYGTMKDWVINLTIVLADGRVIKTRRRPRKSSAGYNLTNLFVGSEGTLGFVVEATLKLAVLPETTSVATVPFPSMREAARAANKVLRAGISIAAMEVMDDVLMRTLNQSKGLKGDEKWQETPTMFLKFGGSPATVKEQIGTVDGLTKAHRNGDFRFAKDEQEAAELWQIRKNALPSILSYRDEEHDMFSTDVAVPLSKLPDIIDVSRREADEMGMFASSVGHIGDGNFHESIRYNKNSDEEKAKRDQCVRNMVDRALEMDGTCTGEHGIGMGKKASLMKELGKETVDVMRSIKNALDPKWLMNPGKVFD